MKNYFISKYKAFLLLLLMCLQFTSFSQTIKDPVTETYKVQGNCGMCEKTIEKAATKKGQAKADWNVDTKILTVTYNSKKTNPDEILKRVAYAGYDNEKFLAPDQAYEKLHECCKYERTDKKESSTAGNHKHDDKSGTDHSAHQQKKSQLEPVYDLYFAVKDALVKDNSKLAAEKSKALLDALDAVKMSEMGEKEHNAFMKYLSDLKTDAGHINESKDIAHQRDHFTSLSKSLYELMKVAKPSYTVYLDHCPMFNDGKGADWISKESAIKNPYYGSQMLTCGKVKETLK